MRTLLLLRGAPGAGKSTFIRKHYLDTYTLRADEFRRLTANPVLNEQGAFGVDFSLDRQAWDLLFQVLEARMRRGDFTIIDATHAHPKLINKYKRLAETYRYSVFVKTINPPLEQVLEQNRQRSQMEWVPEPAIKRSYQLVNSTPIPSFATEIDDIASILHYHKTDGSLYQQVMVIGDIQGCYSVLKTMIGETLDSNTLYVFTGDLLDRGLENVAVFDWALQHCHDKNVIFIEGNHDTHIAEYGYDNWPIGRDGTTRIPRQFQETLRQLLATRDEATLRKQMRVLARTLRQALILDYHGRTYFICHGGLSATPENLTTVATRTLIHGVGTYTTPIDELFYAPNNVIQIHGHRHTESTAQSICLEDSVEYGGHLRAAVLTEQGVTLREITNPKPAPQLEESVNPVATVSNPIATKMMASPYIKVKPQPHHAMSLNFTRKAFKKKIWDKQTIRARGLFIDQTSGDVLIRSYNKFFNVGERPETTLDQLHYPLTAYRKENGFLGLMSVIDGDVVLASKTTMTGPAQALLAELWAKLAPEQQQTMSELAQREQCTFIFEVIHHADRHIIAYPFDHLVLLDVVRNSFTIGSDEACINPAFSKRIREQVPFGGLLKDKQLEAVFTCPTEIEQYVALHHADRTLEGLVLEDKQGRLTKLKLPYYLAVKRLRGGFEHVKHNYHHGIPYNHLPDETAVAFINFFAKRPFDEWKDMHILDALALYEREQGSLL